GQPGRPPASQPANQPSVANHPSSSAPPSTPSPGPSRLGRTGRAEAPYPPAATAAGRFVAVLQAGLASGQGSPQAGQNMFNQLSQLLFEPPGQSRQQQQQRYDQLVQEYDQYRASNQITGQSAV